MDAPRHFRHNDGEVIARSRQGFLERAALSYRPQHHTDVPDHAASATTVAERLAVDPARGLFAAEIERRRVVHGESRMAAEGAFQPAAMLLRQFTSVLILVLVAAAVITGWIGETIDAVAILLIVLLNAAIGFVQKYRQSAPSRRSNR